MKRTALLSVFNKDGIVEIASALMRLNFEIMASGGTAAHLKKHGVPVIDVSDIVGAPILGHRVVTLSREVHAGLLAKCTDADIAELERLSLRRIDLVYNTLYPLEEAIAKADATEESVTEMTDIGGPTLLRSAAKGRRLVATNERDLAMIIRMIDAGSDGDPSFRRRLAARAEFIAGRYALISAEYQSEAEYAFLVGTRKAVCKYGENAWQTPAALYGTSDEPLATHSFKLVAGEPMSYNLYCDLDRALQTASHIAAVFMTNRGYIPRIAVGAKHGNQCGAVVAKSRITALERMIEGDPDAILGGTVFVNFEIDAREAEIILTHRMTSGRRIIDCIAAPRFTREAIDLLKRKGDRCRFLENPAIGTDQLPELDQATRFRYVRGGFLTQPNYTFVLDLQAPDIEAVPVGEPLTAAETDSLLLAWAIGSTSISNTITLVRDRMLIGNGVGQQSRVRAAQVALLHARESGHLVEGAVAYSDSFFPFPDAVRVLADAGVRVIFASSGSVRDAEVKDEMRRLGVRARLKPDAAVRGFLH
jgi:phosphoribosylaminoimidazolecarboxamide formyltransferase/IMP cyclohydrolase